MLSDVVLHDVFSYDYFVYIKLIFKKCFSFSYQAKIVSHYGVVDRIDVKFVYFG